MNSLPLLFLILISLSSGAASTGLYAKPGCNDTCGNVPITYPFGIGTNCSLNKWYAVDCNESTPYLSAFNVELLSLSLDDQAVTVNVSMNSDCRDRVRRSDRILSVDLEGSPFLFSRRDNKFKVEGCGKAFITGPENLLTGCTTTCQNKSSGNDCYGINCCQTMFPYNFKTYSVDLTGLQSLPQVQGGSSAVSACGSAFLVNQNYLTSTVNTSFVPIALLWTLTHEDISQTGCPSLYSYPLDLGNGTTLENHACACSSFEQGSPYLYNGCQVVEECSVCQAEGKGYCGYNATGNITCILYPSSSGRSKSSTLGVVLGVSISMGVIILMAAIFALYRVIRKTRDKRRRDRFFKRNGGLLLKQQELTHEGLVDKTTLFTAKELEKATDYFNKNRILGQGGQGTVYKGMLTDGRIVAVKRSKIVDESQLKQFINEVVVLSQINHRNVVRLLGCCLETDVPLLVSEFISNGTLYNHIDDESDEFPLTLGTRLRIAAEVAGALAYLHSAASIPIYHRDIKSTNILLDDKYRAKISDFGTSRFVPIDQTHLTTLVKGTFGYLDPEYFLSSQFTEKSDVYSFGVVLVELLTKERPILLTQDGEHRSLASHFMLAMEEGQVMNIIDARIIKEGSQGELMALANLAMQCLNMNGKNRPKMKEVASELEAIRMTHVPSTVQSNLGESKHRGAEEEIIMLSFNASTSI